MPDATCVRLTAPVLASFTLNEQKNAKIGDRQRALARKLYEAGLLSRKGLKAVENSK